MSYSIYPINSSDSNLPVNVFGIGYEDNQPHVLRKEGFPVPQIFICKSGEGILKINEIEYTIKKGCFFFLLSNVPHEYYGITDQWVVQWIAFSGSQIDQILAELKLDRTLAGTCTSIDRIEELFQRIMITLKSEDKVGTVISSSILYEILVHLFIVINQKHKDDTSEARFKINNIKSYINEHYKENITLDELSTLEVISPQYLCRLFKMYFNLRPFQYITMKRIQQAKVLLSDNTLSVNEVAHLVGYNDCSYFCAIFKKNEMMSPTKFRGDILNKNPE